MPRAVLFDFFNTLLSGANKHRYTVTLEMGADVGVDPDAFARLFTSRWHERMTGALGDLPNQIRLFASALGGDPTETQVRAAVRRRYDLAARTIMPGPGSVDVLTTLKTAGWPVAIVSNCSIDSAGAIHATSLAHLCDATVLSCEVGFAKPDPAVYLLACERVGVPDPADCVFVGDGADSELHGAEALGMRVIQTKQYSRNDPGWDGERINTLPDLLPRLGIDGPSEGQP